MAGQGDRTLAAGRAAGGSLSSRRGWTIVAALAASETTSYGVLIYAFSVFLLPMERDLGWSRPELTGAYSLAIMLSGLVAVPVGRVLDRGGGRGVMTVGSMAAVVLVVGWSRVDDLTAYYAIWLGIGVAMAMVLYEPAFAVITRWFDEGRGRALLALTVVAGFASTVYVPLCGWLVEMYGWRAALLVLAVVLAAVTVPSHALVLCDRPGGSGLRTENAASHNHRTLTHALHDRAFWWLAAAFFLGTLSTIAVSVHLVTYLREGGYGPAFAATAAGLIGVPQVLGRIVVTVLGRYWSLAKITAGSFAVQAAAFPVLWTVSGRIGVLAFVACFGQAVGLLSLSRAALIGDYYGRAAYGSINGVQAAIATSARALAPVAASVVHGASGSYTPVFAAAALCSALAAVMLVKADTGWARRARGRDGNGGGSEGRGEGGPPVTRSRRG